MNAITLRNVPPKVARAIREKARKERLSLNKAVIRLLEEATGAAVVDSPQAPHRDLDFIFGTWTRDEADEFDERLREQRRIDPEMWK